MILCVLLGHEFELVDHLLLEGRQNFLAFYRVFGLVVDNPAHDLNLGIGVVQFASDRVQIGLQVLFIVF